MAIKVVLVDDHTVVRDGLCALLEADPEIRVVGNTAGGRQAVDLVMELEPDVVIMDISMPEMNGIDATRAILQASPKVRVIILSMLGTADHVFHALQAGVCGYLLKESAGREVAEAVKTVFAGELYFSKPITQAIVSDYIQQREETQRDLLASLSLRESEILCLVVDGKTSVEIGKSLNLSPKTVESYRSRMMQKLGVSDLIELIKFAIKNGLISLD
ncbi:MAG: DNA-binding response regulator [Chloroflexi bacterium RBG_16_54_11]|nr:MAG: DNA-binding response regulator [Chloroflexi bacterium RBG_16_54_11]